MAITEIHPITATVHKAIEYICNPEKTDGKLLISSYSCAPETAHFDFAFTRQNAARQSPNLAHHLIQAFKPGEVTPEEAHRIGKELADSLLKGAYSYVLTTHIDKGHVHNHLIFNAVDNEQYKHYNDCKKTYYHIRYLSDGLCRDHNLSVIEEQSGKRGMAWWEWCVTQDGNSQKVQLKQDINKCIKITDSFEEFLEFMKAKGYQIKIGKYVSFGLPGTNRFIRGKENTLGKQYTKEQIEKRIDNKPKLIASTLRTRLQHTLEMPPEFFKDSKNIGMKNWATKENLRRMAETYNRMIESDINGITDLDKEMEKLVEQRKELKSSLRQNEEYFKTSQEISKYLKQYKETRGIYKEYKTSYFRDRFFQKHEREIIIHQASINFFQQQGIDPDKTGGEKFKEKWKQADGYKQNLNNKIKKLDKKSREFQIMKNNLESYLGIEKDMNRTKTVNIER